MQYGFCQWMSICCAPTVCQAPGWVPGIQVSSSRYLPSRRSWTVTENLFITVWIFGSKGVSLEFNWEPGERSSFFFFWMSWLGLLMVTGVEEGILGVGMAVVKSCPYCVFLPIAGGQVELNRRRSLTPLARFELLSVMVHTSVLICYWELNSKMSFYHFCNWNCMKANNLFSSITSEVA